MIALVPLLTLAVMPNVIELPDYKSSYITFQTIVKVGPLTGKDQICAQIVADLLTDASENFNEDQIRQYSTLAGEQMRCTLSGDHFRVQLEVPKGQMALGGELLGDLLESPRFQQEAFDADVAASKTRPRSYWAETLDPFKLNYKKVTRDDVLDFYHRTFMPATTTIAIGGNFAPGEGKAAIEKYLSAWENTPPPPSWKKKPNYPPAPLLGKHSFPITTIELYGGEFSADDSQFPSQLLLASALGVGKWSSMHRVLREKLGLSYIQQALLSPTPGGFQLHLIMLAAPNDQESAMPETMRQALLEDVKTWDESIRQRALGIAEAYLLNGAPVSPLFFDGASSVGSNLEEQTFLQGYWQVKAGKFWDAKQLLAEMKQTSLDDLKKAATDMLTSAQGGVISGR